MDVLKIFLMRLVNGMFLAYVAQQSWPQFSAKIATWLTSFVVLPRRSTMSQLARLMTGTGTDRLPSSQIFAPTSESRDWPKKLLVSLGHEAGSLAPATFGSCRVW
jgi:hypothetical protein